MRQFSQSTSQSERAKAHLICNIYTNSPYYIKKYKKDKEAYTIYKV